MFGRSINGSAGRHGWVARTGLALSVRKAAAMAVIAAAYAMVSMTSPTAAKAAVAVGPYAPSHVVCDFYTHTMTVGAQIGAAERYTSQAVAYRLAIFNLTSGKWLPRVTINNQDWVTLTHYRVTWSQDFNPFSPSGSTWYSTVHPWAPTVGHSFTLPAGNYLVYTQYLWSDSGYWVDARGVPWTANSPLEKTTFYNWQYGLSSSSYCKL